MGKILEVNNISKKNILGGVSFSMDEGEMVAIMGPSGSGKSTLLYNVSGMDQADGGESLFMGKDIVALSEDEKAELRLTKMGFVFQQMNVIANLNVIDNIMLPAEHAIKGRAEKAALREKAIGFMEEYGIGDLVERKVSEVSGGQLQRACIIRSMMLSPALLFADEPTGALNQRSATEVMDSFIRINRGGTAILMVTHDMKVASKCDRIMYIIDGEIRGELALGKFEPAAAQVREARATSWLASLGW